jgi:hypothetical protein
MLAASPSDRGPSAPSLRMVISVLGLAPMRCRTPRSCWVCRSASTATLVKMIVSPSSLLACATTLVTCVRCATIR